MRELHLSGQLTLIVLSMDLVRVERLEAGGEEDVVSWCWRRRLAGGQQITMIYVRPRRD